MGDMNKMYNIYFKGYFRYAVRNIFSNWKLFHLIKLESGGFTKRIN